ncbi:TPA: hypothetical protein ACKEXE_002459, partial [Enterococcus faecium]
MYSGIGIQFQQNKISTPYIYLMQFVLFMIVFVFMIWFSERLKKGKALSDSDIILNSSILIVFTIIYLFTFLYQLIYSGRSINSFTDIVNIFIHYSPTTFSERLSRKNNEMYVIMTNQIRSIAAPFFYIYLYKVKDKIFKFLLLFTMPILLKTVADGYLSRNNIAVYLAFIGIYLVKEKYIPKTVAK